MIQNGEERMPLLPISCKDKIDCAFPVSLQELFSLLLRKSQAGFLATPSR